MVTDFLTLAFKNIITSKQHGFIRSRSITTNLLLYEQTISRALEEGCVVDSIYTDFSKAFDRVDINLLILKLENYGITGAFLNWLSSYLNGRRQIVKVKSFCSDNINVQSGVPQGGHLAPLLFNIFINDVTQCFLHCDILLYADDLKIFKTVVTKQDVKFIQEDLQRFEIWCTQNFMNLNLQKCKYVQFSKKMCPNLNNYYLFNTMVENVGIVRDLGIIFDSKLTFIPHIDYCCNKAFKMLGFMKRHTKEFKKSVYGFSPIPVGKQYMCLVSSFYVSC